MIALVACSEAKLSIEKKQHVMKEASVCLVSSKHLSQQPYYTYTMNPNLNSNISPTTFGDYANDSANGNVEDLASRLDQMNVGVQRDHHGVAVSANASANDADMCAINRSQLQMHISQVDNCRLFGYNQHINDSAADADEEMTTEEETYPSGMNLSNCYNQANELNRRQQNNSNIIIVTNLDPLVFNDDVVKAKFESLFTAYDEGVKFRYLKSFRRVRLDFRTGEQAELARANLSCYRLGSTEFKCYQAQIIKPNLNSNSIDEQDSENTDSTTYLRIPKLTKQFLISPPASPPVGWEPSDEATPCIDVQLLSAVANLVPGQVHQIHPGNESQPGIVVEVCEEARLDDDMGEISRGCSRIPRTPAPATTPFGMAQSPVCFSMQQ